MKRNCKVIATYFGPRRHYPQSAEETIKLLKKVIENEKKIDPGTTVDTIFVNHDFGNLTGREFLDSITHISTKTGVFKVLHRPWNNGIGGSFASYNYAFEIFRNDYKYWVFNEDDVLFIKEKYFGSMIEQLSRDSTVAFICAFRDKQVTASRLGCCLYRKLPTFFKKNVKRIDRVLTIINLNKKSKISYIISTNGDVPHAHGGVGCTHVDYLNQCYNKFGRLFYSDLPMTENMQKSIREGNLKALKKPEFKNWYRRLELDGEIRFTNIFCELGYNLQLAEGDDPIVYNIGLEQGKSSASLKW